MSGIHNTIMIDNIEISIKANTKRQALKHLSDLIASEIDYSPDHILNLLAETEYKAGSGIGNGIAIPQLKLKELKHPRTVMMILNKPIPFEASDRKPVDIICALLSPEKDGPLHLCRLSNLTRMLNDQHLCERMREAKDPDVVQALLNTPEDFKIAA